MGLDLVEYVVAIEDAFAVAIPDADAVHVQTPLCAVILPFVILKIA